MCHWTTLNDIVLLNPVFVDDSFKLELMRNTCDGNVRYLKEIRGNTYDEDVCSGYAYYHVRP